MRKCWRFQHQEHDWQHIRFPNMGLSPSSRQDAEYNWLPRELSRKPSKLGRDKLATEQQQQCHQIWVAVQWHLRIARLKPGLDPVHHEHGSEGSSPVQQARRASCWLFKPDRTSRYRPIPRLQVGLRKFWDNRFSWKFCDDWFSGQDSMKHWKEGVVGDLAACGSGSLCTTAWRKGWGHPCHNLRRFLFHTWERTGLERVVF